ncbi:MAG: hypothetical protein AB2660_14580 [Candidatus Thiodiazotropha sp.]|nr:hypothetical protein [Candidatus Thiodiazotropha sp. (ex Lucina pensylvanica)]
MRPWLIITICITLFSPFISQAEPYPEQRSNRQLAVTVCNDYRENNRLPCFVSRNDCPRGFEVIERFTDSSGPIFSACRDKRHERPRLSMPPGGRFAGKNPQLLKQFDRLVSAIEKGQVGRSMHLPKASREQLAHFFSAIDLTRIKLVYSKALANGCFTDCRQIFCASGDQVNAWTDPQAPVLSIRLLHQLAHVERCEIQGGRERFVRTWLKHLPDEVFNALDRGEAIDTEMIHFAMYMESHANNRAESICRRLSCERE